MTENENQRSEDETREERSGVPSGDDRPDAGPERESVPDSGTDGSERATASRRPGATSRVRRYVYWITLAGLVGFGGLSALLLYSDLRTAIDLFVADEYVLLIQSAFHAVILLLAAIGVSLVVRRLEDETGA